MGNLSENFSSHEFACKGGNLCCGGSSPVSERLVLALQELRDNIGKPVNVSSGFRCLKYNRRMRSEDSSQHALGMAADIWVNGMDTRTLAEEVEKVYAFRHGGIGVYSGFVHVDVRKEKSRWGG